MKRLIAVILLSFCLGAIVQAADPVLPLDVLRDAQGGDAEAQVEMGILYEYGFRMKGNRVVALSWYIMAADTGNARAIRYRDKLVKKLTPSEVADAKKQSQARPGKQQKPATTAPEAELLAEPQ